MKRDELGRFEKGSSNPWNRGMKGWTNSGSFISEKGVGENNLFYGKHHTDETKKKISDAQLGIPKPKISQALKDRKLLEATKKKIGTAMRRRVEQGIHNFWKGGISRYYKEINHSLRNGEWRNWRNRVFERDNYMCQKCGIKSGNGRAVILHPHHILPVVDCVKKGKLALIYEITNGITLCKNCHQIIHGKIYSGKGEEAR